MGYKIPLMCTNGGGTAVDAYYPVMNCQLARHATTEAEVETPFYVDGVLSNLYVNVWTNSAGADTTVVSRINGADGNMSVTIGASATGKFYDNSNTDTVTNGDVACFFADRGGTVQIGIVGAYYETDSGVIVNKVGVYGAGNFASGTGYLCFQGGLDSITDGSVVQCPRITVACTAKNMWVKPTANSRTSTSTFSDRKNAGAGGMSVAFAAGATALADDTTNTTSIAAGDEYNFQRVTSAGSGTFSLGMVGVELHYPANEFQLFCVDGGGIAFNATTLRYCPFSGFIATNGSEGPAQVRLYGSGTISDYYLYISANAATATQTYGIRKNGASQATSIVVAASSTGEKSDTSNSFTFADTDFLNFSYSKPTGSGGSTLRWFTAKITFDLPASTFVPRIMFY